MREELSRLEAESRQLALSTAGVLVEIPDEGQVCPICLGRTVVQKSTRRNVASLSYGAFCAHETIRICFVKCRYPSGALVTVRSEILLRIVGRWQTFSYDVEVFVGLERFVHHRQRDEIREELKKKGIRLSSGEVTNLARRFCAHLARLHQYSQAAIQEALRRDGGYPLHIDATGEAGRGMLFVAYAGWRNWVLGSWKLATEHADQIRPRLREIDENFGRPCALMRDLGRAVRLAAEEYVSELEAPIPILGCHLHFLRDVGEDLLRTSHDTLRNLFRRFRIRPKLRTLVRDLGRRLATQLPAARDDVSTWIGGNPDYVFPDGKAGLAAVRSLCQWALDSANDSAHLDFPFDRPYLDLHQRSRTLRRAIDAFLRNKPQDTAVDRALRKLAGILEPVTAAKDFTAVTKRLLSRARIFDSLRAALRLTPKSAGDSETLAPKEAATELRDIRRGLKVFTLRLRRERPARGPATDRREAIDLVLAHLKRHGDSLWGHVIKLPRAAGGGIRVVSRTNNLLEGFFHAIKHGERRRSGRKILSDDLEHLPPEAALAYNLTDPEYLKLVCGSLDKLPELFAKLDMNAREMRLSDPEPEEPEPAQFDTPALHGEDRRIVRSEALRQYIEAAAHSRAPRLRSAAR